MTAMSNRERSSAPRGFLSRLVDDQMASTIREDLDYRRCRDRAETGPFAASLRHAGRLVATLGPLLAYAFQGEFVMLGNSIKMARRQLAKHKGFSFINITGLALGMAACLFLVLWVQDELSFDAFHERAADIFRVDNDWPITPYPLGPAAGRAIPEVENTVRQARLGTAVLRVGEKTFYEDRVQAVDPSFLRVFTFPLRQGDAETALNQPRALILTESMARKYFGLEDPMGRTVTLNGQFDLSVTGVMKDVPANSTLQHDFLVPLEFMKELGWYIDLWRSDNVMTWLQLRDRSQAAAVQAKISDLYRANGRKPASELRLVGLKTINLYASGLPGQTSQKIQTVCLFGGLAAVILLIACINFMNLATARAAKRGLEVGLRKAVGAQRRELVSQFYGESLLVTGVALVLALGLVLALLPAFNALAGKSLTVRALLRPEYLLAFAGVALVTGIVSGSYPALYLSSFQPVKVLKGTLRAGAKNGMVRKALSVTQFGLAAVVLAGSLVVLGQLSFLRTKNIGYDKDQLIYLSLQGDTQRQFPLLRERLAGEPNVAGVSGIFQRPTLISSRIGNADWEGRSPEQKPTILYSAVDPQFVQTMKIEMAQGRPFGDRFPGDFADQGLINQSMARPVPEGASANPANGFLINETLARLMGGKDLAGKRLRFLGADGVIVGVMKDFHFQAVQQKIEPLILFASPTHVRYAIIRLPRGKIAASLASIRAVWASVFPRHPFAYHFYDEDFGRMFQAEQRMATLLLVAAGLAMAIACLGLFGLASFLAEQRIREIGIRKTLGATSSGISLMLSGEFVRWVLLGNLIGAPIAYGITAKWLRGYAYRIPLSAWVFVLAFLLTLGVAMLTVGRQTWKAARLNPARCLKYE